MRTKINNPRAKTLVTVVLAIALTFSIATPAFAAEETLNETLERQIMEAVGTTDSKSPEFYAMAKMYSDYFLSFLPTDDEPDALQRLTLLPEFDNINDHLQSWDSSSLSGAGDPVLMRDEAYRVFNDLKLYDTSLSQVDKAKRLSEWAYSGYFSQSVFGRRGEYDGFTYDCNTEAGGLVAVCRLAGIPAVVITLWMYGVGHVDPFFYVDGQWRYVRRYDDTFTDYFSNVNRNLLVITRGFDDNATYMLQGDSNNWILDVDEGWNSHMEPFMFGLLHKPYARPDKALTRGEVAKLICNYISVMPMRNEQIFSDVPPSHEYAPYIWAMNKLGIMTGNGDGTFRPDSELSMQEFAVMAHRVMEWGKQKAEDMAVRWKEKEITPWIDEMTPEEIAEFDKMRREKIVNTYTPTYSEPMNFADKDKIASWAKDAVNELSKYGYSENRILSGDENGYLKPAEMLSKVRFLVFMYKFEHRFELYKAYSEPLF